MTPNIHLHSLYRRLIYMSVAWQCAMLVSCVLLAQIFIMGMLHCIADDASHTPTSAQIPRDDATTVSTAAFASEQAAWSAVSSLMLSTASNPSTNSRWRACSLTMSDQVWAICLGGQLSKKPSVSHTVQWQLLSQPAEPTLAKTKASELTIPSESHNGDMAPTDKPIINNWIEQSNGKRITYDEATDHWLR